MDYDWKYYLEDLRAGKVGMQPTEGERGAAGVLVYRLDENKRHQIRNLIRWMLVEYRHGNKVENAMVENLVKAHAEYCLLLPSDENLRRRHNALVYRYMMKTARHNKAVAAKLAISTGTVRNDINTAIDEILIICFGVPALIAIPKNWQDGVKSLLRSYKLIECGGNIGQDFMRWKWQQEYDECRRITSGAFICLNKAIGMYEEFIAGSSYPAMQRVSLEVVKELYITGQKGTAEVADIWHMSESSVYSAINKVTSRLGELVAYIADREEGREEKGNIVFRN